MLMPVETPSDLERLQREHVLIALHGFLALHAAVRRAVDVDIFEVALDAVDTRI